MIDENIKTKKVDITPDTSLLPKLGHSGYKLAEALADFIDNSLDAKPSEQKSVEVDIQISEKRIIITDNASGMNEKIAINSIKLAYSDKKDKLGEFGLGLKTAATSLGGKFRIKTSQVDDPNWYVLDYDEDEWKDKSDWKSQELKIFQKDKLKTHGTIILIQNLKINYYPNLITNAKRQLSFRFAPYLENDLLKIKINTSYLESPEINLQGEKNEIKVVIDDSRIVTGWYGFLKKRSGFHYGFNLYKHGRLIRSEEKFGFEPHAEVALLYGVLNLDFIPTTHNKREFIESSYEYKLAEDSFKKYLKDNRITIKARELSKDKTELKKKEKVEDDMDEFFDAIYELLKRVKKGEKIGLDQPKVEIKEKEEIEKIKLLHQKKAFNLQDIEEGNFYELNLMGQKYKFKFDLVSLGKEKDIVQYYQENHNVTILINIDFPMYEYIVKDYGLYALMLISEVIAKIVVQELNYDSETLLQIRNLMLRKYGEMQKEILEQEKLEEEERRLIDRVKKIRAKKKSLKE